MKKWPLKLISVCFLMLFCFACNSVPENWHICVNRGRTYLLNTTAKRGGYVAIVVEENIILEFALNIQPQIQTFAPSSIRYTKEVTQRRVLLVTCAWLVRIAKYVKMVCWTPSYPNVALGRCCSACLVGSLRSFGGGCQSHHFKGPTRFIPTKATILYVVCVCYYPWTAICLYLRFEQKPA